jgi:asparagine synthase (glutamine-hydrolysing)
LAVAPDASSVSFGYGKTSTTLSDEFLHCSATAEGVITIRRDAMATLPIFFAVMGGKLLVSNNYRELAGELTQGTLSRDSLRAILDSEYSMPPLREVEILSAQQTLHFDGTQAKILSDGAFLEYSKQATPTDGRQFSRVFADYLDYFIATRLDGQAFAFDVSGGLDSATLPQYVASRHQIRPIFSTAILHDEASRGSQLQKVTALAQKLDATICSSQLDPHANFPLARMILQDIYYPTYGEHTHHEIASSLISQLQSAGVAVLCTGHGGDEFFGNYVTPGMLFQGMPRSTQEVKLINNTYIEHGIWPVSPFMDPGMFAWTQGMPVHLRHDRKTMRAFHKAHGFIEEIYNPAVREDFGAFIPDCVASGRYDALVERLLKDSVLHQLGMIDSTDLHKLYQRVREKQYTDSEELADDAEKLYSWICGEITARYTQYASIS